MKTTRTFAGVLIFVVGLVGRSSGQPVHFDDPKLKAVVEAQLGVTNPTQAQMLNLTSLMKQEGITDLTGLEYATNLRLLDLCNNQISDVSPLAGLTKLEELQLTGNQISDISPLAGLTILEGLYLSENQISDISPLAGLRKLEGLYLSGNQISDISPLAGLTSLWALYLTSNQISDISPLAGLTILQQLYLSENQISDISPLAGLTNLRYLHLNVNPISDISPLAGLTILEELHLSENQISDISSLAGLTALWRLHLDGNQISDISPLAGLTSLRALCLTSNQITDISPLAGLTNLRHLHLQSNPLNQEACNIYIPQLEHNGTDVYHDACTAVQVPNVVGMTLEAAETAMFAAGFNLGITYTPHAEPYGQVIGQDPAEGSWRFPGFCVQLTVSSGPTSGSGTGCLVAHWKLDETTGMTMADSAGKSYNAALFGSPLWQPAGGKSGGALQFDGVDDYARLPIGPIINSLTNSTFATWVNWSGQGGYWQRIFDFGSGTTAYMFLTPTGGTSLRFAIKKAGAGGESTLDAPSNLATGWHHIAIVINGTTKGMQLYLDGSVIKTATTQTLPEDLGNTTQNWLGRSQYPADPYFNGSLDDFRIYECVLSAAEIAQLAGTAAGDPNLVGWWKLDETSGTTVFDSAALNDGVTFGGPLWQPTGGKIGGALQFDGVDDCAQLPIGSIIQSLTSSTFATWVNWSGTGGDWQRVFDFGTGANVNMFLTPRNGATGSMRFAITTAGGRREDQATAPQALATGWHHVAVTIDPAGKTYLLYLDGQVAATKTGARYTPSSLGNTTLNWLGRSQYVDPYFNGSLDDFRVYNRVLNAQEVQQCMLGAAPEGGGGVPGEMVVGDFEQGMEGWGPTWETPAPTLSLSTTGATSGQKSLAIKPNKNGWQWSFMYAGLPAFTTYKSLSADVTWVAAEWGATPWCNFKDVAVYSDGPSDWQQYIPNDTVNPDWPGTWDPVNWGNHTRTLVWDLLDYDATGATWMQVIFSTNFGGSTPGKYYIDNVRLTGE